MRVHPSLLWAGVLGMWGIAIALAAHINDNAETVIVGMSIAASALVGIETWAGRNHREIHRAQDELRKLRGSTKADDVLNGRSAEDAEAAPVACRDIRVHKAVIDGEPVLIGMEGGATPDIDALRRALRSARP